MRTPAGRFHRRAPLLLAAVTVLAAAPALAEVLIPCLSGFVTDGNGNPVANADLDFNIAATGERIITPGDNTDAFGFYTVCVLPEVYDVAFAPPPGTRLMGKLLPGISLLADPGLELDVTLDAGTVLAGVVRNGGGAPVGGVDLDVDRVSGGRIYTPGDSSDPATGAYRVVVPDDLYRLRFEPPRGSRLRGLEVDSVSVAGDLVFDAVLEEGLLLQGQVTDDGGQGVADVDVDLRDFVTGEKVFLAFNATDAAGDYVVSAPAGEYQLGFVPARTSHLIAEVVEPFTIAGDTNHDQSLATGVMVTVVVRDPGGAPVADADLDVKDPTTGLKLFTPHDRTDAQGRAVAVLAPGTYDLLVDPPLGASLALAEMTGVTVTADMTIEFDLLEAARATISGRVVDEDGVGVGGVVFSARMLPAGTAVRLQEDTTAADGTFVLALPVGQLELLLAPPAGTRLVGRRLDEVTVSEDAVWENVILATGWLVTATVTGPSGAPVAAADIDFHDLDAGVEIYTPRDNTDDAGQVTVVVPTGSFRVVVTPPAGSQLDVFEVSPVEVVDDAALTIELEFATEVTGPAALQSSYPNPFNAVATVVYRLESATEATVAVFDLRGRLVADLGGGPRTAGVHEVQWNGMTDGGRTAAAGVYLLQLRTPLGNDAKPISLVR